MFDFGWGELLIIGIVALIVVGDDFPAMFRTMGRFTGKMRRMAREFQRAMEDAANETGVKDATDALKGAANPTKMGLNRLNEAADRFEKWDPVKPGATPKPKGPETQKLSEERAASAKKYAEVTARRAEERKAAEKAAAEAPAAPAEAPETPEAKDA